MIKPLRRVLLEWLLVTACVVAVVTICGLGNWLWRLDLQLHDIAAAEYAPTVDPAVVIVAIDDASLATIGRWPWPREVHARLIDRLREAGAAGVALDVVFSEPAAGDNELAVAMRRFGKVVLPMMQREQGQMIIGESLPVPLLAKAAAALGHIQMEFDPDGIARSVYLEEGWGAARYAQLALALHRVANGEPPTDVAYNTATMPAAWVRSTWLRVPFVGPPGSIRQISYIDVLNGGTTAELRGKLVLIGATSLGLSDSVPVPTSGFSRPMAGVEVHANVLNALRHDGGVWLAPSWANALFAIVIVLFLMAALGHFSPRLGLVLTTATASAILLAAGLSLHAAHFWFGPAPALLGCVLAYPLWSWRRLEATQRYLDDELAQLREDADLRKSPTLDPLQRRLATVREAAAASRAARKYVEDTVAHLPVGVVALHIDGRVRVHNRAARHLLGAANDEALLNAIRSLRWPAEVALENGLPLAPASPLRLESTTPKNTPVLVTLSAIGEHGGLVIGIADLTEIRAAQQAREDTLRYVSHDLRSPLASIISLIDSGVAEETALPRLRKLARSALDLADEMFRLGRAETADPKQFVPVDLMPLVDEAMDQCWELARNGGTRVEFAMGDITEALVIGNGELLRRAIVNLLGNAIKYGGDSGAVVEVQLERAGEAWQIAVRDHGPGIPPEERDRLFQRFSRLPSAVRRGLPGIGLGLAMVRTVAERHGGAASVEFPRDGGSRFVLTVPAAIGAGTLTSEGNCQSL